MSFVFVVLTLCGFSLVCSEHSFSRRLQSKQRIFFGPVHQMEIQRAKDSGCPPGNTCLYTNRCCPLPYARQCADGVHCCPSNTTCNAVRGDCEARAATGETVAVPWERTLVQTCTPAPDAQPESKSERKRTRALAFSSLAESPRARVRQGKRKAVKVEENQNQNQVCPDGRSMCSDQQTCCQLASGSYGCCPLPDAVCCGDHEHCCPSGFTCDLEQLRCIKSGASVVEVAPQRTRPLVALVSSDGSTRHESPVDAKLTQLEAFVALFARDRVRPRALPLLPGGPSSNVICPDQSECPDQTTCCQMESGDYGCCPMPDAVCCSDKEHCCPSGTTCDLVHLRCVRSPGSAGVFGEYESISFAQVAAMVAAKRSKELVVREQANEVCPDQQSECPDGTTCCLLESGEYGCCPYPNAVCCSDKEHCCPEGTKCDLEEGRCIRSPRSESLSLTTISEARAIFKSQHHKAQEQKPRNGSNQICPDGRSSCQDYQTCCLLRSGTYGCCPYSSAVCCADYSSCCPFGYVCNIQTHQCLRAGSDSSKKSPPPTPKKPATSMVEKSKPLVTNGSNQICPDGRSSCQDYQTCCLLRSGTYGCCPYSSAVCCADYSSCCPFGYVCNIQTHQCLRAGDVSSKNSPLLSTAEKPGVIADAKNIINDEKSVATNGSNQICPDGRSSCQDYQTCCLLRSGTYGCCPYSSAVCCADYSSCCPFGYVCNIQTHQCLRAGTQTKPAEGLPEFVPMRRKLPARLIPRKSASAPQQTAVAASSATGGQCPDGHSCCNGNTCCALYNAKCCADGKHCCPSNTVCNLAKGTCDTPAPGVWVPWERVYAVDACK